MFYSSEKLSIGSFQQQKIVPNIRFALTFFPSYTDRTNTKNKQSRILNGKIVLTAHDNNIIIMMCNSVISWPRLSNIPRLLGNYAHNKPLWS